jgi:hypothetical protein
MKVVYEQSIIDKIITAKHQSDADDKPIAYIEVTREEAMELKTYCRDMFGLYSSYGPKAVHNKQFMGITIKVEGCKGE